jgi:aprataxin
MSVLNVLKEYARAGSSLPPTVLLTSSSTSLSIFDKYPKSKFHFLVLPRLPHDELKTNDLTDLRTLLAVGKRNAVKSLLEGLKQDGLVAKSMIEEEMASQYGYKWEIWMGFHAVPSMK